MILNPHLGHIQICNYEHVFHVYKYHAHYDVTRDKDSHTDHGLVIILKLALL